MMCYAIFACCNTVCELLPNYPLRQIKLYCLAHPAVMCIDINVYRLTLPQVLENRTKASRNEMDQLDELEELREINARHAKVDTDSLIEKQKVYEEYLLKLQQEEEDELVQ